MSGWLQLSPHLPYRFIFIIAIRAAIFFKLIASFYNTNVVQIDD